MYLGAAEQLDNVLPRVVGGGRAARLAQVCASPALRRPCTKGQRWRCVLLNGRWRRHKCKYEVRPTHFENISM